MTKILHIVYQSYPNISGSSTRTRSILLAQKAAGMDVVVVSAPGQAPENAANARQVEWHEGIAFHRCYLFSGAQVAQKKSLINRMKKIIAFPYFIGRVYAISRKERPDILHAHAMFYCAFAALFTGRLLGIPVVYEERSIWYSNSEAGLKSLSKMLFIRLENYCVSHADGFVAISKGIAEAFKNQRDDVVIVRNAVAKADISEPDLSASPPRVFGFIGSVIDLEGLGFVIEAFARLKGQGLDTVFHIVGGGSALDRLKALSAKLDSPVIFHGQIPFSDVPEIYSGLDCVINYRRDEPVAHNVTPLKPIEGAAHGVLMLCSDVGGMVEIMGGYDTAIFVPPNDVEALVHTLKALIAGDVDTVSYRKAATKFIRENRTWEANATVYARLYSQLMKGTANEK